ncbi:MAG: D-alanyl-D-alanine carboxypeptidase [Chloroflexi bacterium]|nr:D-alanyl-D-alanine carboxypeptidase [Chloroflexota bacterium]
MRRAWLRQWCSPPFTALVALLLLNLTVVGFGPPTIIEAQDAKEPVASWQIPLIKALQPPSIVAEAAVAIDGETGQILYAKNPHQRMAPASTTKIATAILALEAGRLKEAFDVRVDSRTMVESSVMGLTPGVRMSLEGLLYGLLVQSGNDAAVAIAQGLAGSEEAFVAQMNEKAKELGLTDTHFVNPHGLDAEGHYMSPYDLAILARYAMRDPVFRKIVATTDITIREGGVYPLRNSNHLLEQYQGITGVKTGYTDDAGRTLVASAKRDGHEVIVVVMKTTYDRWFSDAAVLLDYVFDNFTWLTLNLPESPLNRAPEADGQPIPLKLRWEPTIPIPRWQVPYIRSFVWPDHGQGSTTSGQAAFYMGRDLLVETALQ